ncbi:MAG: ATP-binding domain-containing protein [Prevotella sp.]|jgi:superfamily I DNA/RNA helicase|nr:ATP-binding domain-containing protein [Prevotella sp.]MCH4242101.1 ATP-binding domain-containing protein [Prevotella sp.]
MDGDFYVDFAHLNTIQTRIVTDYFYASEVVLGRAGTGKSLIALHKLARVPSGHTVALVVFTKSLKKYFEDGLKALGIKEDIVYYRDQWLKNPFSVDYLFVDECQDFNHEEIESFKQHGHICFFFGDSEQTIMNFGDLQTQSVEQTAIDLKIRPHVLTTNYRLTYQNAAVAEYIDKVPQNEISQYCIRDGSKPFLLQGNDPNEQLDMIIKRISIDKLTRVGILVPYNTEVRAESSPDHNPILSVQFVAKYFNLHGMPVEVKENSNNGNVMDIDFESNLPKIISYHSAKGLQFNDVFIPFCETVFHEEDYKRRQQYVAVTRAWSRLYICYSGQLNKKVFPPENSELYSSSDAISNI